MSAAVVSGRGQLPSPMTSFVGRRQATATLKRALADSRLVRGAAGNPP